MSDIPIISSSIAVSIMAFACGLAWTCICIGAARRRYRDDCARREKWMKLLR